jgi:hypothetical protein
MTDQHDPLRELLLDAVEIDRARIALALKGLVGLDQNTGRVVLQPAFRNLSNPQRIAAVLLALRAAQLMGVSDTESVPYKEMSRLAGMPDGSVASTLSRMRDHHEVSQTEDGQYYLADHDVLVAVEKLEKARNPVGDGRGAPAVERRKRSKSKKAPAATKKPDGAEAKTRPESGAAAATPTTTGKSTSGRSTSGVSVKQLILDLVKEGFFDHERSLRDAQDHLSEQKARNVKITTLSPAFTRLLRDGVLRRRRTDDGVYVYWKA